MGKLSTGWKLLKESFKILLKDKELLWIAIFSLVIEILLFAGLLFMFLIPASHNGTVEGRLGIYPAFFLYYLLAFFVGFFLTQQLLLAQKLGLKEEILPLQMV